MAVAKEGAGVSCGRPGAGAPSGVDKEVEWGWVEEESLLLDDPEVAPIPPLLPPRLPLPPPCNSLLKNRSKNHHSNSYFYRSTSRL